VYENNFTYYHTTTGTNNFRSKANRNSLKQMTSEYKYLETIITDQNCIHGEIKSRLNSGNGYYHSVRNLLSSSKNIQDRNVVLFGCETWSFTLREEYTLKVFENRVLRRIFGPKRQEEADS
jgi:hypothetical protein